VIPEVVDRPLRRPYVAHNDYISHRVTVPTGDGRVACDCGAGPFDTATELERHQNPHRHRVPDFSRRRRSPYPW